MADPKVDKDDKVVTDFFDDHCESSDNKEKKLFLYSLSAILLVILLLSWLFYEKTNEALENAAFAQTTADEAVTNAGLAQTTADGAVVKVAEVEQSAQESDKVLFGYYSDLEKQVKKTQKNMGWAFSRLKKVEKTQKSVGDELGVAKKQLKANKKQLTTQEIEINRLKNRPKGRIDLKLPKGSSIKACDGWVSKLREKGWSTLKEK